FGDYYAQTYVSAGIVPWFSFTFVSGRPAYYDPLFPYYRVVNVRENPRWVAEVRQAYVMRRENVALRPPRTYVEQTRLIQRNVTITRNVTVIDNRTVAMPVHRLAADPVAGRNLRMVHVNEEERQRLRSQATQLQEVRAQRLQQEREAARGGTPGRPRTMKLPPSPIAARPATHPAGRPPTQPSAQPGGAAARAAVAHRGEAGRLPERASEGPGSRPAARAAEPHRAPLERPGAAASARRPVPGGEAFRPREAQGM